MEDLERDYSPSSRAGGSADPYMADYQVRSAAARRELGARVVEVGAGSLLVAGEPGAPLLVFVHGGYWQALSAGESLFLAPPALRRGWSFAAVEYTLAPDAGLPQMVQECATALVDLVGHPGLDPSAVVLAGHSAGAHLAAMITLVHPAPAPVDRVVLVSGVYDLRRLIETSVNIPLGLAPKSAEALSPLALPHHGEVPEVVVAWAENDTDAFAAQSRAYCARTGARPILCAGRHHFDIVDDLVNPSTELGSATLAPVRR